MTPPILLNLPNKSKLRRPENAVSRGEMTTRMSDRNLYNATTKIASTVLHDTLIMTAPGEFQPLIQSDSPDIKSGSTFGPYVIHRKLGAGGMGEVYEALDTESGRRVALKLLGRNLRNVPTSAQALALDSEWQKRFFREGRLAAQISHPSCVYVYGTSEVNGVSLIAMEYVSGGTLEDLVEKEGPLDSIKAVDMILDILDGLQAAANVGVLHRDVKPSNCFLDSASRVKVGDFGLSVSTHAEEETRLTKTGTLLGTPAFASPEQLQGHELDIRSDIYSVGATLYYLLTGDIPFKAANAIQMVANVLAQAPSSVLDVRADVPDGVAGVIQRCLAKDPNARYQDYDQFRTALLPFSSQVPDRAPIGARFAAGVVDWALLFTINVLFTVGILSAFQIDLLLKGADGGLQHRSLPMVFVGLIFPTMCTLYYGLLEGLWGASLGKRLLGIRIVNLGDDKPSIGQGISRAIVYCFSTIVLVFPADLFATLLNLPISLLQQLVAQSVLAWGPFLLLFSTMRARDGHAAVHDLLSRTRVVETKLEMPAPEPTERAGAPTPGEIKETLGPYAVTEVLYEVANERLLRGFDPLLQREVWLHVCHGNTQSNSDRRRDLNRLTRLRWVTGRHKSTESWDAYEVPLGQSFLDSIRRTPSWKILRRWLYSLVSEIHAGLKDATLPDFITLEHLWVKPDGRIVILDFPLSSRGYDHTGSAITLDTKDHSGVQQFLRRFVEVATGNSGATRRPQFPLHAGEIFAKLRNEQYTGLDVVLTDLSETNRRPSEISFLRRTAPLIIYTLTLVPFTLATSFYGDIPWASLESIEPRIETLDLIGRRLVTLERNQRAGQDVDEELAAFRIYTAFHFANTIKNPEFRNFRYVQGDRIDAADTALEKHPNPSSSEVAMATEIVESYLAERDSNRPSFLVLFIVGIHLFLILLGMLTVLVALTFRGTPLKWILGMSVVNARGEKASRLRLAWRTAVVWTPWFCALGAIALARLFDDWAAVAYLLCLFAVFAMGTVLTISGRRSIQDRVAGTYLVPR